MEDDKKTTEDWKQEIAEKFGWDKDVDSEKIDEAFTLQQDRARATKQKKKAQKEADDYRKGKDYYKKLAEQATQGDKPKKDEKSTKDEKSKADKADDGDIKKTVEGLVQKMLNKSDLSKMDLSDELTKEIQDYANFLKKPVKEVIEKPVIKKLIKDFQDAQDTDKASLINKHRSKSGKDDYDFSQVEKMTDAEQEKYIAGLDPNGDEFKAFTKFVGGEETKFSEFK